MLTMVLILVQMILETDNLKEPGHRKTQEDTNTERCEQGVGNSTEACDKIAYLEKELKESNKRITALEKEVLIVSGIVKKLVGQRDGDSVKESGAIAGGRVSVSLSLSLLDVSKVQDLHCSTPW